MNDVIDYREIVTKTLRRMFTDMDENNRIVKKTIDEITARLVELDKITKAMNGSDQYYLRSTQVMSKVIYDYLMEKDYYV